MIESDEKVQKENQHRKTLGFSSQIVVAKGHKCFPTISTHHLKDMREARTPISGSNRLSEAERDKRQN